MCTVQDLKINQLKNYQLSKCSLMRRDVSCCLGYICEIH